MTPTGRIYVLIALLMNWAGRWRAMAEALDRRKNQAGAMYMHGLAHGLTIAAEAMITFATKPDPLATLQPREDTLAQLEENDAFWEGENTPKA
jgi:hypothetical protein